MFKTKSFFDITSTKFSGNNVGSFKRLQAYNEWNGTSYTKMPGFFTPYQSFSEGAMDCFVNPFARCVIAGASPFYLLALAFNKGLEWSDNNAETRFLIGYAAVSVVLSPVLISTCLELMFLSTAYSAVNFITRGISTLVEAIDNTLNHNNTETLEMS